MTVERVPDMETNVWRPFVWSAICLAGVTGFGLGSALFLAAQFGAPAGSWWAAAAQVHGHVQLFGWAGLMIIGVGFHFLPRLLGTPLPFPDQAFMVLVFLLLGLLLRTIAQPALALTPPGHLHELMQVILVGSGTLELIGATLALHLLVRMMRSGGALRERADLSAVAPFFVVSFTALWLALGVNLAGIVWARTNHSLINAHIDQVTVQLALYGFLIPIAVAMSIRLFPLYIRTPRPSPWLLRAGLGLALVGLAARVFGELAQSPPAVDVGRLIQSIALVALTSATGIFGRRRPRARQSVRLIADPFQWHAISAYVWLTVTTVVLAWSAVASPGAGIPTPPGDVERHTIGTGFITLLIFGVGARLLPGFARRPPRSGTLVWATFILGNAAALLRVGPVLVDTDIPPRVTSSLLGSAGIIEIAALIIFSFTAAGVPPSRRRDRVPGAPAVSEAPALSAIGQLETERDDAYRG